MRIVRIEKEEWSQLSEKAHKAVFKETKPVDMDRIDFALVCENEFEIPMTYITCRENDKDTIYFQYGGAFPGTKDTMHSFRAMQMSVRWCKERYKRIHFYVENTNKPMLKMAMKVGFLITGIRNYKNHILIEHLLEF